MKLTKRFFLATAAVGMLFLSPAIQTPQAHADIVEFGDVDDTPADIDFGLTAGADFTGTGVVLTQTGVTLTTGEVFDLTVTFTAGAGVTDIFNTSGRFGDDRATVVPAGTPAGSPLLDRFQDGSTINIAVDVSNPLVNFDGFTNFSLDRLGNAVGFNIDGQDYLRGTSVNSDNDPRQGIVLNGGIVAQDNVDITFLDTRPEASQEGTVLRGFALQFTAVPEPSSLTLLGLLGLGFASRRRK